MFYYLSFLRPLPLQANSPQSLVLTPQIANDLRTELCSAEIDIYYRWMPSGSKNAMVSPSSSVSKLKKFSKLTTWREANAYKEVIVPPPKDLQTEQSWQLILTTSGTAIEGAIPLHHDMIDISQPLGTFGRQPFPVVSVPINLNFRSQSSNKLKGLKANPKMNLKQEEIERLFSFSVATDIITLRIREQLSFDLDKKLWDSGVGLSNWLTTLSAKDSHWHLHPQAESSVDDIMTRIFNDQSCTILELGAGTGIVSIILAALLANRSLCSTPRHIWTSDLPTAMELIEQNIVVNEGVCSPVRPRPLVLNWDDDLPKEIVGPVDVVIMADVTYNTASFPSLISTLRRICERSSRAPLFLLAYKERDPAERTLWNMADEARIHFVEVDQIEGAGGRPIEIYIGTVIKPCVPS